MEQIWRTSAHLKLDPKLEDNLKMASKEQIAIPRNLCWLLLYLFFLINRFKSYPKQTLAYRRRSIWVRPDGQEELVYQRCKHMAVKLDTEWPLPNVHLARKSEIRETANRQCVPMVFNTNGRDGGRCKWRSTPLLWANGTTHSLKAASSINQTVWLIWIHHDERRNPGTQPCNILSSG